MIGPARKAARQVALKLQVVQLIKEGLSQAQAASYCGIHPQTICEWKRNSDKFASEIQGAETDFILSNVKKVNASDDWKAAAWLLERRDPMNWSRIEARSFKERMDFEISNAQGVTPEELEAKKEAARQKCLQIFNISHTPTKVIEVEIQHKPATNGNGNGRNGHAE